MKILPKPALSLSFLLLISAFIPVSAQAQKENWQYYTIFENYEVVFPFKPTSYGKGTSTNGSYTFKNDYSMYGVTLLNFKNEKEAAIALTPKSVSVVMKMVGCIPSGRVYNYPGIRDYNVTCSGYSGLVRFNTQGRNVFILMTMQLIPNEYTMKTFVNSFRSKCSISSEIISVNEFTGRTSSDPIRVRACPTIDAPIIDRLAPNKLYEFEAWTVSEPIKDEWTGKVDNRWFKLKGKNGWVASAVICGNPKADVHKLPCFSNNTSSNQTPEVQPGSISNPSSTIISQPNFELSEYRRNNPLWNAGFAPKSTKPSKPQLGNKLGNCTWYANGRARELGGNSAHLNKLVRHAGLWSKIARENEMSISKTPQVGAIAQWDPWSKGYLEYGHVAVVERVNSDGTILISESSFGNGNWNFLHRTRTINAKNPDNYIKP
jgi:surface antigen